MVRFVVSALVGFDDAHGHDISGWCRASVYSRSQRTNMTHEGGAKVFKAGEILPSSTADTMTRVKIWSGPRVSVGR